jgi:hypothetical protein
MGNNANGDFDWDGNHAGDNAAAHNPKPYPVQPASDRSPDQHVDAVYPAETKQKQSDNSAELDVLEWPSRRDLRRDQSNLRLMAKYLEEKGLMQDYGRWVRTQRSPSSSTGNSPN